MNHRLRVQTKLRVRAVKVHRISHGISQTTIGTWKINVQGTELIFRALTCIDPVTNLVEIIRINSKSSSHVSEQERSEIKIYPVNAQRSEIV